MRLSSTSLSNPIQVDFDPFSDGELSLTAPLTESQKEIWASVQMGPAANCAYNESQTLRLRGQLDLQGLERAFQVLIEHHEALRATCSPDGTTLCIAKVAELEIASIDLSTLDPQTKESHVAQLTQQTVETPFDLEHGPLFRVQVVKINPEDHLVLITAHHIICDGWSVAVIISDLAKVYTAIVQSRPPQLGESERFSQYAMSCAEQEDEDIAESLNYWLQQFSDFIPVVDFPTDRPRPALRTFDSARIDWQLSPELITQLKQLGTSCGCSFLTTLLAGFEVFLSRLTGQSDVIVGIPAAGQAATGQYELVGHCVNLLPLRTQINSHQSFQDYLNIRKSTVLDAYEHQQFTFGTLVQKLPIARDPSRIPLVPIVFNIDQGLEVEKLTFANLQVDFETCPRSFENFELFINATELKGKVTLECQYNTNLFDPETIQDRLAELETLLQGIITNPQQQISKLPLLPESEHQWLAQFNAPQTALPGNQCLHQLFEAQVIKTPNAVAVIFEDTRLTYQELNHRANRLAAFLQKYGVGPECLVGIYLERSLDMLVALLAILKAGGVYVPLDPSNPPQRLALVLEDSQILVLVTQNALVAQLPDQSAQVICLDSDKALIALESSDDLQPRVSSSDLAYVIYTSGSTGKPKGVQITHLNLMNLLLAIGQKTDFGAQDIFLAVTTISFDIAALELYLPLINGATVVVASREVTADGMRLKALLEQSSATFMQATPATWQMLLTVGWQKNHNLKILCGGEALSPELARDLIARSHTVWNAYGPTETTIWSTMYQLQAESHTVPIGQPLANTQTYILDANLQSLPRGVPGELCIGGAGLAQGYLNRQTLTAEKFISVSDASEDPEGIRRLYKTGDLARYLPDGNIEWLGRMDHQVKVRGFRIELGEIEANLHQHPAVHQAVVAVHENTSVERVLVGYFVTHSPQTQETYALVADIRQFLQLRLPDFMVPSYLMPLETFPYTPNGKVDRKALPQPDVSQQLTVSYIAPRNPLEATIVEVWSQVFNQATIGVHDNFFELGGYSLLAIQIVSRLRQTLDIDILLPDLFESPTVADLAQRVEVLRWSIQGEQELAAANASEFEEGEL